MRIRQPVDLSRRSACSADLSEFCRVYGARTFYKSLCADHVAILSAFQLAMLESRDQGLAADRGKGKTSLTKWAMIWALLYGWKHLALWVGATFRDADRNLENVKRELETNKLLLADFPEVCQPIRALQGSSRRAAAQTANGQPTLIDWATDGIRLPHVETEWAEPLNAYLYSRAINGAIRGLNVDNLRPDAIVLDDVETRESVRSVEQSGTIRKIIDEDIGGLAGQGEPLTRIYLGTIMARGCLTDEFTDPRQRPGWNGQRYRFMITPPTDSDKWREYVAIWRDIDRGGPDGATAHYLANREAMDAGAVMAWEHSFNPKKGEVSSLQAYYNALADKGISYVACELQNDPTMIPMESATQLTVADVLCRCNRYARLQIPVEADCVTAFVDVGEHELHYAVVAFRAADFAGWVIDYGAWPPDPRDLGTEFPDLSPEARIRTALDYVVDAYLAGLAMVRDDGIEMGLSGIGVDCGHLPLTIYQFCRESKVKALVYPAKGAAVKYQQELYGKGSKGRKGNNWIYKPAPNYPIRYLLTHPGYWKHFVHKRLLTPIAGEGALTIYGDNGREHRKLADHICAEALKEIPSEKGTELRWVEIPNRPNHWLDCLAGAHAAASFRARVGKDRGNHRDVSRNDGDNTELHDDETKREEVQADTPKVGQVPDRNAPRAPITKADEGIDRLLKQRQANRRTSGGWGGKW